MVTDIIMPVMRGDEMIVALREIQPDLKVLYLSGYPGKGFSDQVPLAVNTDFLRKPFTSKRLLLQLRQTLDREASGMDEMVEVKG